ncbi:hypothetical protein ACFR97_16080 [Haloplanus litoreus]|uniref:SPW repeat-containing protein n=1 Tax=Haloplanus litoreus TaxID=767515 RepID=A0ABD6A422_9EURY
MPSRDLFLRLGILVVLIGGGVLVISSAPTVSIGGYTVPTGFTAGVLGGFFLLPAIVSHYREGEQRESLQWGLFAIGIPLSLTDQAVLLWIGLLAILGSLGVGWKIDRRIRGRIST